MLFRCPTRRIKTQTAIRVSSPCPKTMFVGNGAIIVFFFREKSEDSISVFYTENVKIIESTINPSFYKIFQNSEKTCESYSNQMLYG